MKQVYFSALLKSYGCWPELEAALKDLQIDFGFLEGTRDIWVRDFMPLVGLDGRYITYRFDPDYLRNQPEYRTDGSLIAPKSPLEPVQLDLIVDGGNFIREGRSVLMTNKVIKENKPENGTLDDDTDILHKITKATDYCHVNILPWDKNEPFGHIDGMMQFVDETTILLTNYCDFDEAFRQKLLRSLAIHKRYKVVELHYDVEKPHKDNWAYINFLKVGDKFILPRLNAPEDEQARKQIAEAYHVPEENIRMVDIHTLLKRGGGLHCVSWNAPDEDLLRRKTIPLMSKIPYKAEEIMEAVKDGMNINLEKRFAEDFAYRWKDFFHTTFQSRKTFFTGVLYKTMYDKLRIDKYEIGYEDVKELCQTVLEYWARKCKNKKNTHKRKKK